MSTRCQVKVSEEDGEAVTLYHHWDGYPTAMLPVMAKAYTNGRKYLDKEHNGHPDYWELGRAGHIASFLCREQPDEFEPEAGHKLHGDIEWYYELKPSTEDKSSAADPQWIVTVYKIEGFDKGMTKIPVVEGELLKAAKMAKAIQDEGNKIGNEEYEKKKKMKV